MMNWIIGATGLLLAVTPFVFGGTDNRFALWTSICLGALVIVVAGYKALLKDAGRWEYWFAGIIGIAAIAAPFVFGFTTLVMLMWAMIALGAILVILDGYEVFANRETAY